MEARRGSRQERENSMVKPARRVVTGHDASGKAVVLMDGPAPNQKLRNTGLVSTLMWATDETPADISGTPRPPAGRQRGPAPAPAGGAARAPRPPLLAGGVVLPPPPPPGGAPPPPTRGPPPGGGGGGA